MNKIIYLISASLLLLLACNKNEDQPDIWRSLATVDSLGVNDYVFRLDGGAVLKPTTSEISYKSTNNQRVFTYYNKLGETPSGYDIHLLNVRKILTKQSLVLTAANKDSIGDNSIRIYDLWASGGFLNIHFGFFGGQKTHYVNLVKNSLITYPVNDTVYLEFRHNSNKDPQNVLLQGLVCFDLKPFQMVGKDQINFSVRVKELNNERTYKVAYKYKGVSPVNSDWDNIRWEIPLLNDELHQ